MNEITQPPNQYDFGLDFSYASWPINTLVDLINVDWNNDYRDVVRFSSSAVRKTYLDGRATSGIPITQMSYVKPNEPIRINIPFNRAVKHNYLRARNPQQPVPGSDEIMEYFYFINDVRYLAPNTTELVLQLDIWQTYLFNFSIGSAYVERGHIGIANSNQRQENGRKYLTVNEGIDAGSDMQILGEHVTTIMSPTPGDYAQPWRVTPMVMVISTVDLDMPPENMDQSPRLSTASGGRIHNVPTGATYYFFRNSEAFSIWLKANQDYPWMTQGIMAAYLVPNPGRYLNQDITAGFLENRPIKYEVGMANDLTHTMWANWRDEAMATLPTRYQHLYKFLTSSYMIFELTGLTGNPIIIKPELWSGESAQIYEMITYLAPAHRLTLYPANYNSKAGGNVDEDFDHATHIANFPSIAVVNNGGLAYLAANYNSINWQRDSADWSQQRAINALTGSYDVAKGGVAAGIQNSQTERDAAMANTANQLNRMNAQNTTSMIGTPIAGLASGGIPGFFAAGVGSITSGVNNAHAMNAVQEANNIFHAQNTAHQDINSTQGMLVADTNKSVAEFGAKGDYANTIASIDAKVQDAAMIQPSVSGQAGGETQNFVHDKFAIMLKMKMIDSAAIARIGDYWLRYGYRVHRFIQDIPDNLRVMQNFSYWKLSETYLIASNMPEGAKQVIRGILEKGVTVWNDPTNIGQIDIADNTPLGGISY